MLSYLLGFVWGFSGAASFIFWWTKEFDFKLSTMPLCYAIGCVFGPLTFILGWTIHGRKSRFNLTLIRGQNAKD